MKKYLLLLVSLIGTNLIVNAGLPQVIELTEVISFTPQGGPFQGSGDDPGCYTCFTAIITDDILSISNNSQESVNIVVTNIMTNSVILSTQILSEFDIEEQIPAGNYHLQIIPQTSAAMEGYFVSAQSIQ